MEESRRKSQVTPDPDHDHRGRLPECDCRRLQLGSVNRCKAIPVSRTTRGLAGEFDGPCVPVGWMNGRTAHGRVQSEAWAQGPWSSAPLTAWLLHSTLIQPTIERLTSPVMRFISCAVALSFLPVVLGVVLFVTGAVLAAAQPISLLPAATEAGGLLGTLLTAQAAIAALTLAVTIFVMEGVSAKREADERMHGEYIRRSGVRPIFWTSLIAVAATGLVLLAERFGSGVPAVVDNAPGLRNLALVAAISFFANLFLALMLFEQAVRVSNLERWRAIRRDLNEEDVREALQIFLRRYRRIVEALAAGTPDASSVVPDAQEGSATRAVTALLDDARRAMDERRQGEFTQSLNSIKKVVGYAMDELVSANYGWGAPGSQPHWPPLRELSSDTYPFREEVIRRGDRDQVVQLMGFDCWLMHTGWSSHCGEMFTVGLDGHRHNQEIARRAQRTEFHAGFRDQLRLLASAITSDSTPEEAYAYLRQVLRHQERLLSDAMNAGSSTEYERIHHESEAILLGVRSRWLTDSPALADASERYEELARDYRITLMGLGGRAMILADAGRLDDPAPYLDVVRGKYGNLRELGEDVARVLPPREQAERSQWLEWEMEGADEYRVRPMRLERYPLTLFAVRLMELAIASMPTLNLHGNAQQVLNWFENNVDRLERHVREAHDMSMEGRRILATDALRAAVRTDEVAADHDVIERELNAERVETFASEVKEAAFATNSIERLFERVDAKVYLSSDADGRPDNRGFHRLEPKDAFATVPENASGYYEPLGGERWGRGLSGDMMERFCAALGEAPQIEAPLDTTEALLRAIDEAAEDLRPSGELAVVLAGDWHDVLFDLSVNQPNGYESQWQIPEADQCGEEGRYRGHRIFRGPPSDERMAYVVDPREWGSLVSAQVEGDQDILIRVDQVSADRAKTLLDSNPDHFPDEPDEASKLRKLQTYVEVVVGARTAFRVADPSRVRWIVDVRQVTPAGEDEPERDSTPDAQAQSSLGALLQRLWRACRCGKQGGGDNPEV